VAAVDHRYRWELVAVILLRFDYTSVSSISLLFGFVALAAGFVEIGMIFLAAGWWKLLNAILAFVFIVAGVVAFIHPGEHLPGARRRLQLLPHLLGTFDMIQRDLRPARDRCLVAAADRRNHRDRPRVLGGRLLRPERRAARRLGSGLAIIRGVRDIVLAFRVREVQHPAHA
jgi:hypothetical protein